MLHKILFASSEKGSWIDRDRELLQKHFQLRSLLLSKLNLLNLRWVGDVLWSDMVFLWFGSLYTLPVILIARLFFKKVVVISGGFDVAKLRDYAHGAFCQPRPSRILRRLIFFLAHEVICVSRSNAHECRINAWVNEKKIQVIPHGFIKPRENFRICPWSERKKQVLMISSIPIHYYRIKGLDNFIQLAKCLPQYQFIHMGLVHPSILEEIQSQLPQNLRFCSYMEFNSKEFLDLMAESRILFQGSAYESFGASVVDAAISGCFPMVSDRFALPELIDKYGKILPYGETKVWKQEILRVMELEQMDCELISADFLSRFSWTKREVSLLKLIAKVLAEK